tara:strand:+ start:2083 stop:2328 length:246 start_codon:yes stop_codon:yes gene_type:complete
MPTFDFPSEPYFVIYDENGRRVYFTFREIGDRVRKEAPETLGEHIFVQIDALGLNKEFERAGTPHSLPYTFAEKNTGENNA